MSSSLIVDIAKSLALARWRQSLVAAIGVTFGITMFIGLLGFMTGLNDLLDGLILNRTAHVRLYNDVKPSAQQPISFVEEFKGAYNFIHSIKSVGDRERIYNSDAIIAALKVDDRVLGLAPKVAAQVFFNEGSIEITGVVNGIDADAESKLFHFDDYVIAGKSKDIDMVSNSIILGKGLADRLLATLGDVIQVTTSTQAQFPLRVVGIFQSGIQEYDKVQSYASIGTVQKLLGKPTNYITEIQIKIRNIDEAPTVAKAYAQLFETEAEDIQTANAQFETGSFVRSLISYAVGITLLIVAGFGIYNILNMMIYEKMDSIAILKATGFSGTDVNRIFMVIALSIGFFGGALGLVFGFLLSLVIDQIPFDTPALPTITTYPVNYSIMFYIIGLSFSMITTFFAGWAPARKASKVDPVTIIRGK